MKFKTTLLGLTMLTLTSGILKAQESSHNTVKIVGEMKNVMWKGQLYGTINQFACMPSGEFYAVTVRFRHKDS